MTRKLTKKEIAIIDAAEKVLLSLCNDTVLNAGLDAYSGRNAPRKFVGANVNAAHRSYNNDYGESLSAGLQTSLDKLYADNPSACEAAERRVKEIEADLERAREHARKVLLGMVEEVPA